jgi:hypothetical protein
MREVTIVCVCFSSPFGIQPPGRQDTSRGSGSALACRPGLLLSLDLGVLAQTVAASASEPTSFRLAHGRRDIGPRSYSVPQNLIREIN